MACVSRLPGSPPAARVLIVDDDSSVTDTFSRMLRLEGHEVWAALSAREGVKLAQTHRPTAVIVDLRSPLGASMDLVRTLKAMPHLATTPMAIISGDHYPKPDHVTELSAIGVDLRFKPLWLDELVALARRLLAAS
jgi:two-component system OmpR family response regulator